MKTRILWTVFAVTVVALLLMPATASAQTVGSASPVLSPVPGGQRPSLWVFPVNHDSPAEG